MTALVLDGLGGDHIRKDGPGALSDFLQKIPSLRVLVATDQQGWRLILEACGPAASRLEWLPAEGAIAFREKPLAALRARSGSSIQVAFAALRDLRAEALISFGHTGATVAAAQLGIGRHPGIRRPGLAALLPNRRGQTLLMDVGATTKCTPQNLLQFGTLAAQCCRESLGIANPRIGLLNVGEEEGKGDRVLVQAFELMHKDLDGFVGNVEGYQIFDGTVDAVVCGGLTGNIVLKAAESLADMLFETFKENVVRSPSLLGSSLWQLLEHQQPGARRGAHTRGACRLLGVNGVVMIGHGAARTEAICDGLKSAAAELTGGLQSGAGGTLAALDGSRVARP